MTKLIIEKGGYSPKTDGPLRPPTDEKSDKVTEIKLHTTTDAAVWAEEFMKIANKLEIKGIDEGWMIGWFANALQTGENFGRNSVKACQCP